MYSRKNTMYLTDGLSKTRLRKIVFSGLVLHLVALAACTGVPNLEISDILPTESSLIATSSQERLSPQTPTPTETMEIIQDRKERQLTPPSGGFGLVPIPSEPRTGEVPQDLLDAIINDLLERQGIDPESVTINRAEAVTWSDGSLGCPQPGAMYTQALVDGYWVVLEAEGIQYDYRVSDTGSFLLCEGKGSLQVSPPILHPDK